MTLKQRPSHLSGKHYSPCSQQKQQSQSNMKVMSAVFFGHRGVIHQEYAPQRNLLTRNTTWLFYVAFSMLFNTRDHNLGLENPSRRCICPHTLQIIYNFFAKQHWITLAASILSRHGSVSFSIFPSSKYLTKEGDIETQKTLSPIQQSSLCRLQKMPLNSVFSSGLAIGKSMIPQNKRSLFEDERD